jgi:hypothetical protein
MTNRAEDVDKKKNEYGEIKKRVKRAVAITAKDTERKDFAVKLDTEEGKKEVFKIAKQIAKEEEDVVGVKRLKNELGEVLLDSNDIKDR